MQGILVGRLETRIGSNWLKSNAKVLLLNNEGMRLCEFLL